MDQFLNNHQSQLDSLNIPEPLVHGLKCQLETAYGHKLEDGSLDLGHLVLSTAKFLEDQELLRVTPSGSLLVIPHVCSWDILEEPSRGMMQALGQLPRVVLETVWRGLCECFVENHDDTPRILETQTDLLNAICDLPVWSRVILYRAANNGRVRAALPTPPYFPQHPWHQESDPTEADLTGPFPFQYYSDIGVLELSLVYLSPGFSSSRGCLPTIDLVPAHIYPDPLHRAVRFTGLLGSKAPDFCRQKVMERYTDFLHQNHVVRQKKLEQEQCEPEVFHGNEGPAAQIAANKVLTVYTDANDPLQLSHPETGLCADQFTFVDSPDEADIIYSYQSLFAPGELRDLLERRSREGNPPLINQFPYEGAFVQKDHLAREILRQHGLPLPSWALETYDLDVHMAEFVAAALLAEERGERPVWIVKPAQGTQSKGHVVTTSVAHICRLVDAGGTSRVVQRYISNLICVDGRKVDCRCLVMMTSAEPGRPTLYMHNTVFFRIAHKQHLIDMPGGRMDNEVVMTAAHLLAPTDRSSKEPLKTLPTGHKTIAKLEADYGHVGFDWKRSVLPSIRRMICELFIGMTKAFPPMGKSLHSRALYGVDVMFQIDGAIVIPKLTEVTFCPANNAICDAYELDENLRRNYCLDTFNCLYRGMTSRSIRKLAIQENGVHREQE